MDSLYPILITGQFDRNSANIAKICARAFEQGPISFRRVLEKFGGSNSQKYMSCSCREVKIFIAIHIYLKPDSPFSFCDLSVYMPVQLGASPPLPPLNYFSLPPPLLPVHTHTHTPQGISRQGPFWKDIACWCNSSKSTRFVPSLLRKYQGNIKFTCPTVLGLFV